MKKTLAIALLALSTVFAPRLYADASEKKAETVDLENLVNSFHTIYSEEIPVSVLICEYSTKGNGLVNKASLYEYAIKPDGTIFVRLLETAEDINNNGIIEPDFEDFKIVDFENEYRIAKIRNILHNAKKIQRDYSA
jgi:hypothetical protein